MPDVLRSLLTEPERPRSAGRSGLLAGARVRAGRITFFGFFRTEEDVLEDVTAAPT
jgi:hypothetical protein